MTQSLRAPRPEGDRGDGGVPRPGRYRRGERHHAAQGQPPRMSARAIVAGVTAAGQEDILPDPMSRQVYAGWQADHKAVEKQFAAG